MAKESTEKLTRVDNQTHHRSNSSEYAYWIGDLVHCVGILRAATCCGFAMLRRARSALAELGVDDLTRGFDSGIYSGYSDTCTEPQRDLRHVLTVLLTY